MKKRLIFSLAIALLLVATLTLPAVAATEDSRTASVTVGAVMSITLTDPPAAGINFGSLTPPITGAGDVAQSDGTPAIEVVVGSETNVQVDIGIKGTWTSGLALSNWKYSTTFAGTKTSLLITYVKIYGPLPIGASTSDVYHWIDVPSGTTSGAHSITVNYKVVATGGVF